MIEGQVARIISDRQLALNIGKNDGVEIGMKFAIYAPADVIIDPDTGENLGQYRHRKATVVVTTLADRFCFVGPIKRNPLLSSLLGSEMEQPPPSLPVEQSQVEPFPTGTAIRVGDSAEQIGSGAGSSKPDQGPSGESGKSEGEG